MTIKVWQITECHRVTCGCETYISAKSLHALFILWRKYDWINIYDVTELKHAFRYSTKNREHYKQWIIWVEKNTNIGMLDTFQVQPYVLIMTHILTFLIGNIYTTVAKSSHHCIFLMRRKSHRVNNLLTEQEHKKCT